MRIVPAFDELEHRPTGIFLLTEGVTVEQFTLQGVQDSGVSTYSDIILYVKKCPHCEY